MYLCTAVSLSNGHVGALSCRLITHYQEAVCPLQTAFQTVGKSRISAFIGLNSRPLCRGTDWARVPAAALRWAHAHVCLCDEGQGV